MRKNIAAVGKNFNCGVGLIIVAEPKAESVIRML
jgi:phosphoribosylaminoimidazole (AIR) synthetase